MSDRPLPRAVPSRPTWARPGGIALIFAGWIAYGVMIANIHYLFGKSIGMKESFMGLVRYQIPECLLWALLTFPILAAARRWPVTSSNWARRIPLHLGLSMVVHFFRVGVMWVYDVTQRPQVTNPMPYALVGTILLDAFIYVAIAAVVHAASAQGQAIRFRNELLEAELRLMRMQLQPHFLFNSLHAVAELARTDPERAERAITRLADLLRWSLRSSGLHEVPLRDELTGLENYFELQRLRHGDRISFRVETDPATLGLAVPGLLLQPLVENAIRHGMRGVTRGTVRVRAARENGHLAISIRDDGAGLVRGFSEGTGLRNTRARLAGLYGEAHRFEIRPDAERGTVVDVTLPARAASATTPGLAP